MSESAPGKPNLTELLASVHVGTRPELEVSRHEFGGQAAYVVRDPITFHTFKLSQEDYQVFVALNADRQLKDVFQTLVQSDRLASDQEQHFYQFVFHLNQIGLLNLPISDGKKLYARYARRRAAERRAKITGILFLRVPLFKPDAFLSRTIQWFSPLFTMTAFAVWLVAVGVCGSVVWAKWDEFLSPLGTMLAASNVPILWSLLVGLKVIHEFGHAYACKHFGGKVPEMGAFFILFTPCAYIDASASWGFPKRSHRLAVSLAGMYFESIAAMGALLVWTLTAPGLLHAAAQYAVILSTVITIGFNINPLMKYDGYYILSDLVGMPNLKQQATAQVQAALKRLCFGISTPGAVASRAGQFALLGFGLCSSLQKALVLFGISLAIAWKIPAVGLGMAAFYFASTLWQMSARLVSYIRTSDEVAPVRGRAMAVTLAGFAAVAGSVLFVPVPGSTEAQGVLGRQQEAILHASSSGFLVDSPVEAGKLLHAGDLIGKLENSDSREALARSSFKLQELWIRWQQALTRDVLAATDLQLQIAQIQQEQQRLSQQVEGLEIRSPIDGQAILVPGLEQTGRFIKKGDPLATIAGGRWVLRALTNEGTFSDSLLSVGDQVDIALLGIGTEQLTGHVSRIAKKGMRRISAAALTHVGGGDIPVSAGQMEAADPYFEIEIVLDRSGSARLRYGAKAQVRLPVRRMAIGTYVYRRGLQLIQQLQLQRT